MGRPVASCSHFVIHSSSQLGSPCWQRCLVEWCWPPTLFSEEAATCGSLKMSVRWAVSPLSTWIRIQALTRIALTSWVSTRVSCAPRILSFCAARSASASNISAIWFESMTLIATSFATRAIRLRASPCSAEAISALISTATQWPAASVKTPVLTKRSPTFTATSELMGKMNSSCWSLVWNSDVVNRHIRHFRLSPTWTISPIWILKTASSIAR